MQAFNLGKSAAAKIYYTIDRNPPIDSSKEGGIAMDKAIGKVELKDVKFSYPSRPNIEVLKSFSLVVEPGQSVALVGSSGSGKSTIIQLIERFYDPLSGVVEVDNVPIQDLNLPWLRQQIGLVSQEPTLFEGSFAENVAFGLIGSKWESLEGQERRDLVIEACKKANAHDFILKLPKGYDTNIGQRGLLISGGQKQRVAIARAIIKDPKILLLDEATSALDTSSERIVQDALDRASKCRTTITIAHRLSTIKGCDLIVVMSKGQIVEKGTHSELIAMPNGMYHGLVEAQHLNNDTEEDKAVVGTLTADEHIVLLDPALEVDLVSKPSMRRSSLKINKLESGEKAEYSGLRVFRGILRLNIPDLRFLIPGFIAAVISGLVYPFFAIVFGSLIGVFTQTGDTLRRESDYWASLFVVLAGITMISNFVMNSMFGYASEHLTERIRKSTFSSLLNQDISFYDDTNHGTGVLTSSLSSDAQKLQGISGLTLGNILTVFTTLIGCVVVALANGWKLAIVATFCLPLLVFTGYFRLKVLTYFTERAKGSYEKSAQVACEAVAAIRTIQSLTREADVTKIYSNILDKPLQDGIKSSYTNTLIYAFSQWCELFGQRRGVLLWRLPHCIRRIFDITNVYSFHWNRFWVSVGRPDICIRT